MRRRFAVLTTLLRVGAFAACVQLALAYPFAAGAQQPATAQPPAPAAPAAQAPGRGRGPQPIDPRVQIRMHHFADTNEEIPYALFVSSKVNKDTKAPMIVTLHGLENLETVEGNLFIHLNANLESITALGKLHTITGSLTIDGNTKLPQSDVDWLLARVTVGGQTP